MALSMDCASKRKEREMYKLEVRKNGEMVDYDSRRFATRDEAGKARSFEVLNVVGPFVDMRVRRA